MARSKDKEEAYFSGKTPPSEMGLQDIRQYTAAEPPSQNTKLHQMLMKLDGYGLVDQQKRLLLLTDQNNRTYALRYLAQHLDLIHTVDLVQSLHVQMMRQIKEFGNGHFDGFEWPWQWGPKPAKADPIVLPLLTQENVAIGEKEDTIPQGVDWPAVRARMMEHELAIIEMRSDYWEMKCACGRDFSGDFPKWEKHQRAKVKELFVNGE